MTKIRLQRQIEATDQQIDGLVYELYGLTDKEIQIVEEGANQNVKKQKRCSTYEELKRQH